MKGKSWGVGASSGGDCMDLLCGSPERSPRGLLVMISNVCSFSRELLVPITSA